MLSDLRFVVVYFLLFFLFSFSSLPLTFYLFPKFFDGAYAFSKTIGIITVSFIVFLLATLKLLPFTITTIFFVLLVFVSFNYFFIAPKINFWSRLRSILPHILFQETLFFVIFCFWAFLRGHNPEIEGLEKFMDWGFLNSILRSKYFPPKDMWFAGQSINYYYYGHYIFAMLTKMSGITSSVTYNISVASIAAWVFACSFSFISNLIYAFQKKIKQINFLYIFIGALVSSLILGFGGNLHTIYKITKTNIENNNGLSVNIKEIKKAADSYWYPDATRFIGFDPETKDKTIHEFPVYSYVVADLHAHLNGIPIILLFIALLFSFTQVPSLVFINWLQVIICGLILSVAYMTNAWDFAIYGILFAIFTFIYQQNITKTLANGLAVVAFWYIFCLPFSLNFTPMFQGILLSDQHTPFYQLFILYGGFWLIILPYLFLLLFKFIKTNNKQIESTDYFIFALIITATLLIILPEIIYLKDIYIFEHRRANTMFKLVYQAFIMYSLSSGYILIRLLHTFKKHRSYLLYKTIFLIIFLSHIFFSYFAIKSNYLGNKYSTLSGLGYLKKIFPDDYKALLWLEDHHPDDQPVVLEAVGDSYSNLNHLSAASGFPTVQGWIVHEWLWRGNYDEPSARANDVKKIYEGETPEDVLILVEKYKINYILIGPSENKKYKIKEEIFVMLGFKEVFREGETKIYRTSI